MRRVAVWVATIALCLPVSGAMAEAGDAYDPSAVPVAPGDVMLTVEETGALRNESSIALMPTGPGNYWHYCSTFDDPTCAPDTPGYVLNVQSLLPMCSAAAGEFCIEGLELAPADAPYRSATYVRSADSGIRVAPDPSRNLVEGSSPSLFSAPDVPNAADTSTYAVRVVVQQNFNTASRRFELVGLQATVVPYRVVVDAAYALRNKAGCAYFETATCGTAVDFTPGTKARLKVRIPSSLGGWFRGRITDPSIDVVRLSDTANLLTVEGESMRIPRMAYAKTQASFDAQDQYFWDNGGKWGSLAGGMAMGIGSDERLVFEYLAHYREVMHDTAAGVSSSWTMLTTGDGGGSTCLADKSRVLGIVTTNAMGYDGTSPSFVDGALNYRVVGLHYLPDGKTPVLGSYNLVMRSDTARCLYGFTAAPVQATISVVGETDQVATTVVGERNGWLKLAAYNFTFSEKAIRVALAQEQPKPAETVTATPSPTATPTPTATPSSTPKPVVAQRKITITCVKGKVTKKVTAVKPVCPAGWKKR